MAQVLLVAIIAATIAMVAFVIGDRLPVGISLLDNHPQRMWKSWINHQ